jgi:hypothetical protein
MFVFWDVIIDSINGSQNVVNICDHCGWDLYLAVGLVPSKIADDEVQRFLQIVLLNYSHSRNPPCAPAWTHGQIQAPREPPN